MSLSSGARLGPCEIVGALGAGGMGEVYRYVIETGNLVGGADTVIDLYASDCATLLASDDDGGDGVASRILWTAPAEGGLFDLRVTEFGGSYLPPGRGYTIGVTAAILPFSDGFESGDAAAWSRVGP